MLREKVHVLYIFVLGTVGPTPPPLGRRRVNSLSAWACVRTWNRALLCRVASSVCVCRHGLWKLDVSSSLSAASPENLEFAEFLGVLLDAVLFAFSCGIEVFVRVARLAYQKLAFPRSLVLARFIWRRAP